MKIVDKSLTDSAMLLKKNYNAVDLAKFLMCLCVAYAHIAFFQDIAPFWNDFATKYVMRLTVPFFFMTTSFFLFRRVEEDKDGYRQIKKYIMKFLRLYIVWTLLYMPAVIVDKVIKYPYGGIKEGILYAVTDIFRGASYTQLWFLAALCVGTAVTGLCLYIHAKPSVIVCFAFAVYALGIWLQSYYGLFFGFLFIALGLFFARKRVKLKGITVAAGFFLSGDITSLLGADRAVFSMTKTYLRVIMLFAPAFILNDICICFVRNDGNPRLSMFAMLTGSLSNIILDYLFIFPLDMGIFGAVLATGMAPVISMLVLSIHWLKGKNRFHLQKTGMSPELIFSILPLGFPSLITELAYCYDCLQSYYSAAAGKYRGCRLWGGCQSVPCGSFHIYRNRPGDAAVGQQILWKRGYRRKKSGIKVCAPYDDAPFMRYLPGDFPVCRPHSRGF